MNVTHSTRDNSPDPGGLFEPFDLSINLGPDNIPFLSATSRAGSWHGIPRRSASLPQLPDLLDMVYDYTDAVRFAERQPDPELSKVLGELVFGDPLLFQLFQATRGVAADRGRHLLVRILASPHLAVLPWELLPDPAALDSGHGSRYLALAPDIHLVRQARGLTYPARAALLEAPLNLLIVLSSPTVEDDSVDREDLSFDIFEVKRGLLAELFPLVQAGLLRVNVEDRPTLENLRRQIGAQRRGYHLFHYVGHAKPENLILEDRAGRPADIPSHHFLEILRLCPDLRLAVFAGCETGRPAGDPALLDTKDAHGWRDLLSLTDYCVQKACPAVIGMQAVLPFTTERVFTRFFYQALASGYSVAEAMRLARGAIHGDERIGGGLLDWSVPALFVGSNEPGPLVQRAAPRDKPVSGPKRWELILGLRQSESEFFSRDLPLRQAVDIMTGQRPERVLLITGAAGVGKTSMVDRVLEELGDKVTYVLHVSFDKLAPEVVDACSRLEAGQMPDLSALAEVKPDRALKHLCELASELLRDSGISMRAPDSKWTVCKWWEQRVIQNLVHHRFVLVIDEIGLLDRLQKGLLEKLIEPWLAERVDINLKATPGEQLLDNYENYFPWLKELENYLQDLPKRQRDEIPHMLGELLDRRLAILGFSVGEALAKKAGLSIKPRSHVPVSLPDSPKENLISALKALEEVRLSLSTALRALADRRSNVRILLTAAERPRNFPDLPDDQISEIRVAHLTWPETWRFIRRKLPALLSYGEVFLRQVWLRLGSRFDRWEELERRVLHARGREVDLQRLAEMIAPLSLSRPVGAGLLPGQRGLRPLRIAVAGPHLAAPSALEEMITRLALEHGLGGKADKFGEAWLLASCIDEPSPFNETGVSDMAHIIEWLQRVMTRQPDIILLDYGDLKSPENIITGADTDPERILLRGLQYGSLLIAAGGHLGPNSAMVTTPSVYPEVLSVGPLDNYGELRPYAEWHPELKKPDLFMADDLAATALAAALNIQWLSKEDIQGSSFAALHAVATATLVWSIIPELSPREIRALLVQASKPIDGREPARSLMMQDAIALARVRLVERTLRAGAASLQTLSASTGLEKQILWTTLYSMIKENRIVELSSGRLVKFQLSADR